MIRTPSVRPTANKNILIFPLLWALIFLLYLPAVNAGKAGDYYFEWLDKLQHHSAFYFISAPYLHSLYYFTQAFSLLYYKLFGTSLLAWHLLSVTLHAVNAWLLYIIFGRLLADSGIRHNARIALGAALLYCISPYNTEVIVHEPCYHYSLGFLMLLLIINSAQKFIHAPQKKYAWAAAFAFLLSLFSIEIFYLAPLFVFSLACYYAYAIRFDRKTLRKVTLAFVIPQLALFAAYIVLLVMVKGHVVAHNVDVRIDKAHLYYLDTTPKYLFHLFLMGRYFPGNIRTTFYYLCNRSVSMLAFLAVLIFYYGYIAMRFKKMSVPARLAALFVTWLLLSLGISALRNFPSTGYVTSDRYIYFVTPFAFILIVFLVSRLRSAAVQLVLLVPYSAVNLFLLIKTNNYWRDSAMLTKRLITTFPQNTQGRIILFLNLPENLEGAEMIGARPMVMNRPYSCFKLMYNSESSNPIVDTAADIASFNMEQTTDGAHVTVLNDSTINVALNQPTSRWFHAAGSIDNELYRLNAVDKERWYQLTLKRPASRYLLLYIADGAWKQADMNRKNVSQY